MKQLSLLIGILLGSLTFQAVACTGITLTAKNGDVVYARTMEWGSFDLHSRLVIYPRNYQYRPELPGYKERGMNWIGRYGVAGIDALNRGCLLDGMNEKGLTAGLFYHPGIASYPEVCECNIKKALSPTEVLNFILSNCATVNDVRCVLGQVVLVNVKEPALGFPAPVHVIVTEPSGKQLIVEWVGQKVQYYDSQIGVFTNAPCYPWHLTNLRNYVNLTRPATTKGELGRLTLTPIGSGSEMCGLPGDYTPPSRFVRAAFFAATARQTPDGQETLYEAFRILDNFNVPVHSGEGNGSAAPEKQRSSTVWTIAHDHARMSFYFHTQNDRMVQKVDLKGINFNCLNKALIFPLDNGQQTIKDRTPKY